MGALLIHLVGGPAHGQELWVPDDKDRIEIPEVSLRPNYWVAADPDDSPPITRHVYVRNPWHRGGEPVPYVLEDDLRRLAEGR